MAYAVRLKPRAEHDLDRLPIAVARRIWQRLLALEEVPLVEVVRIAHRREVYR